MALLDSNDALGVVLQLEQMLGIVRYICPPTMLVDLIDVACAIHASL
jgi:hypothetical protein